MKNTLKILILSILTLHVQVHTMYRPAINRVYGLGQAVMSSAKAGLNTGFYPAAQKSFVSKASPIMRSTCFRQPFNNLSTFGQKKNSWNDYRNIGLGLISGTGLGAAYYSTKDSNVLAEEAPKRKLDNVIIMPSREVLHRRLVDIGLSHFIEKTNILEQLAGQEKVPMGVAMAVELAIHDYLERNCKSMPPRMCQNLQIQMAMIKPALLRILLQDNPEALEELAAFGLYNPED